MPLSFPSNPILDQTTSTGGTTWIWDGEGWAQFVDSNSSSSSSITAIYNTATTSTGYFALPLGSTLQRLENTVNGGMRLNTSTNYIEIYFNNNWYNLQYIGIITASGGTVTTFGNYKIHTFTLTGNFVVTDAPTGSVIEVLMVGGGAGGGTGYGGGGGAGGYYYNTAMSISQGTYSVIVGAGGTSVAGSLNVGTSGGNTSFNGVIASGGGGGGAYNATSVAKALDGGSGGGAGGAGTSSSNIGNGSQGGNGGVGVGNSVSNALGGGGGGAGANGGAASGSLAGNGGIGIANPIANSTLGQLVSSTYYLGGGGGGGGGTGTPGSGGSGGGGAGQITSSNGLLPHSVTFSTWNFNAASVASTSAIAPDGTATASIINASSTGWDMYYNQGLTGGVTYYFTIWVKLGSATNFCVAINNAQAWNTVAGNKAYTSADGLNASTWTKIVHPFVAPSTINLHLLGHADGITQQTAGTIYMWGAMLYATSPTQATSALSNTGGGGGGGGAWNTGYGGNGGSGLCIIRYRYQ